MEEATKENVATVINAFSEIVKEMASNKIFSIGGFIKHMESIFDKAGYRDSPKINCYSARRQTKILILQDAGAGDFVIISGAIREIRRLYPNAYITLVVKQNAIQLAELCPYVDEVILNNGKFSYSKFSEMFSWYVKFSESLLKRRYDICYSFAYLSETQILMYMSGARIRISINVYTNELDEKSWSNDTVINFKKAAKFSTCNVPRPQYRCHRVDMAFFMLEYVLNAPIDNRSLETWYSPLELAKIKDSLKTAGRPLYALCMGGSHPRKFYPPEKYAKFLKLVVDENPNATFLIIGAGKNDLKSAEILKNSVPEIYDKNVIDLTNKINYRQSAAALSLCDAYIGNDTGTMHLATAVQCPVLEINCHSSDVPIMNGDDIAVYYPYGVPNVIIRPKKALPECTADKPHNSYGCKIVTKSHCITQINPRLLFEGLKLLKRRIVEKNFKPLYLC